MEEDHRPEQAPQERVFASHNGFEIGYNPSLANGWVEFRDKDGNVIGHIDNVKSIYLAPVSRS